MVILVDVTLMLVVAELLTTLGLTLRAHHHGNLCCPASLLWSGLRLRSEMSGGEIIACWPVSLLLKTCEHRQFLKKALSFLLISKKDQEIWFYRFNISVHPFSSTHPYWSRVGTGAYLRVNIVWGFSLFSLLAANNFETVVFPAVDLMSYLQSSKDRFEFQFYIHPWLKTQMWILIWWSKWLF